MLKWPLAVILERLCQGPQVSFLLVWAEVPTEDDFFGDAVCYILMYMDPEWVSLRH
jgi:hypothetical protein